MMKQVRNVLVTGGAGYIGSHICKILLDNSYNVIVVDDLSSGKIEKLDKRVIFHKIDILNTVELERILKENRIYAVIHLAAKKSVHESIIYPDVYQKINYLGTKSIIEACNNAQIKRLVFSSTCAVYGEAIGGVVCETSPTSPTSPYGITKLNAENLIKNKFAGRFVILRFFNVIGAATIELRDSNQEGIIPALKSAVLNNLPFRIFGCDYDTRDGTCLRDYIDVRDIAKGHLLALNGLHSKPLNHSIINLGSGSPTSVLEILRMSEEILGRKINHKCDSRRMGDVVSIHADVTIAERILGFKSDFSMEESLTSSISRN